MVLRILGIALAVWIVLAILGSIFKLLVWALVIGAVLFVGSAVYAGIRNRGNSAIR